MIPADEQKQINIGRTTQTKSILANDYQSYVFTNYISCKGFHTRGHFCYLFKARKADNLFHLNHDRTLDRWGQTLNSLFPHQWPNLVLSKHAHTHNMHNSRTLKKDSRGLDFRRQSHFYPKVALPSTYNVTFKWNTACSDSLFANNTIYALT